MGRQVAQELRRALSADHAAPESDPLPAREERRSRQDGRFRAKPKYVGDPINAVRIFNEKEVDELFVADIDATALGREPDYVLIKKLAAECRMPLCYGGGIRNVEQAERLVVDGRRESRVELGGACGPWLS